MLQQPAQPLVADQFVGSEPNDYVEEAAFYRSLFEAHCRRRPRTLLDLVSGGGHHAAHLKAGVKCTLVDLEPAVLALSSRLNPECEHVQGDMRSIRLGRVFDCVLLHAPVSYMISREDLAKAIVRAYAHTAPGGVALFQPDFVTETFTPGTATEGSDAERRALRYLEWRWDHEPTDSTYLTELVCLLRPADGTVQAVHDQHVMGLFPRAAWLERWSLFCFTCYAFASPPVSRDC